jgi:DNA-binding CsgD family transcriptional regulator
MATSPMKRHDEICDVDTISRRHSMGTTEPAEESRRLRKEFISRSIDLSLTVAGFADAEPASDGLRQSCQRAFRKRYGEICSMLSRSHLADLDLHELMPRLQELQSILEQLDCERPPATSTPDVIPHGSDESRRSLDSLTPRETEVLRLVAEGHSTKEIAHMLGMSFKTAACHRYRVMDKLAIHDAVSLTRYAFRMGLVQL